MSTPRVYVIGDANVDMVIRLPDHAAQTPENVHFSPQLHGGGSAANTAVALARLGLDVAFIGSLGDDGYGRWVLENFMEEGVDSSGVVLVKQAFTPMVMALIEPSGDRHVAIWPEQGGAHFQLRREDIDPSGWGSAAWLHTTGMCLRASPACEAILYAMESARAQDLRISLDLNLRLESWGLDRAIRAVLDRAIALSDVVLGNGAEEILPFTGSDTIEAAVLQLSDGVRTVIARQGQQDAIVAAQGEVYSIPTHPVEVVDTLGAGDAFNGGYIAARLRGAAIREATAWGHAAAAYKIGRVGARNLPTRADLEAILGSSPAEH